MDGDFSKKGNLELLQIIRNSVADSDIGALARDQWEVNKIIREDKMLSMTENLVKSTDKMLTISKCALAIAIISCGVSVLAVFLVLK